jgi:hypothetical protein
MKKTFLKWPALTLAAALASSLPAEATLTTNTTTNDLLLGFRADSGTGASQDYLVDIGSFSLYTTGTSFVVDATKLNVAKFDLNADLSGQFGNSWNTLRDDDSFVQWGIVGTSYDGGNNTSPVLYVTRPRDDANTQSTPWTGRPKGISNNTVGDFQQLTGYFRTDGNATPNNSIGTLQDASNGSSYNHFVTLPTNLDFGVWSNIEGNFANGTASSVLDLYRINPVNGQDADYLGYFSISDTGVLTFTAVPEPGTVALLALAGSFLLIVVRRRKSSAA